MAKALASGDSDDLSRASGAVGAVDEDSGPTVQQYLDRLRRNCH